MEGSSPATKHFRSSRHGSAFTNKLSCLVSDQTDLAEVRTGFEYKIQIEELTEDSSELVLVIPRSENAKVKKLSGAYFDWQHREWRVPPTPDAADVVSEILRSCPERIELTPAVSSWLAEPPPWMGHASIIEREDGPIIQVEAVRGTPPAELDSLDQPHDGYYELPFTADSVALIASLKGLHVDASLSIAGADLRLGRIPPAASLRLGRDEHDSARLELLPGWSFNALKDFHALPEAVVVASISRRSSLGRGSSWRAGDSKLDADDVVAIPADGSLWPRLSKLLRKHSRIVATASARDQLGAMRQEYENRVDSINLSKAQAANPITKTRSGRQLELGGTLEPFQHAGVRYILNQRNTFIADEQGLGKTVQSLAALEIDDAFPAVVICPAGMKLTWLRETNKWLPNRTARVIQGSTPPADQSAFDITIVNYEIIAAHQTWLSNLRPKAVIFDESHYCKSPTAQRTKAALALSASIDPAGLRLALTGTPVLNRPQELTAQLRLVGRLKDFGSGAELSRRFEGPESHDRLHWHLRAHCFLRRLKIDVLPQLPAKRHVEVPLELANESEYALAERSVIAWLKSQPLDLRELDAKVAAALRAEQLVRLNSLRQLSARGKLPGAVSWIRDFLQSGEPLVVFAQHREVLKALVKEFPDALHLLGDDDPRQRERAVQRFQAGEEVPVRRNLIICSMRAAGQGITLTRASNVAFVELDWTPALHDQAEDRCHRMGQHDAVTAWYLVARRGIDSEMSSVLAAKRKLIDAVVDGRYDPSEPVSAAVVRALRARPEDF